jgi:hypothetical protein
MYLQRVLEKAAAPCHGQGIATIYPMTPIYISIGIFLVIGGWLSLFGLRRLWQRRFINGSLQGLSGLLFLSLAVLAISIAMNLYTYEVFTYEEPVAEVRFEELGNQYYRLYYIPEGQAAQTYEIRGDEWQVDARVIKWTGLANLAGMRTLFRVERISGRYRDVQQERLDVRSVYSLKPLDGLDVWTLSRKNQKYIPWIDAVYGSAAYLPMAGQARFQVSVSATGLVVRAKNAKAQQAIDAWN